MAKSRNRSKRPATKARSAGRRPQPAPGHRRPRARVLRIWFIAVVVALGLTIALRSGRGGSTKAGSATFVGADLHSLAADPITAGRLYVGGHNGVAVSSDSGARFRQLPSLRNADAMGWAFTANTVWQSGHFGLHSSKDGSAFSDAGHNLPSSDLHALGGGGDVLYAASPAAGFLVSTDGGRHWEVRNEEVGQSFMGRMLVDPNDTAHVLAPDMSAGVVETTDGGLHWRRLGGVTSVMWVSATGNDLLHLFASSPRGALESPDGGQSWRAIDLPEGASLVEASPQAPQQLYAAGLTGDRARIWTSDDGGQHWRRRS